MNADPIPIAFTPSVSADSVCQSSEKEQAPAGDALIVGISHALTKDIALKCRGSSPTDASVTRNADILHAMQKVIVSRHRESGQINVQVTASADISPAATLFVRRYQACRQMSAAITISAITMSAILKGIVPRSLEMGMISVNMISNAGTSNALPIISASKRRASRPIHAIATQTAATCNVVRKDIACSFRL